MGTSTLTILLYITPIKSAACTVRTRANVQQDCLAVRASRDGAALYGFGRGLAREVGVGGASRREDNQTNKQPCHI